MAVMGAALFGSALLWKGSLPRERPRIVIPATAPGDRAAGVPGREPPRPQPGRGDNLLDYLVDDEVLYQYALKLGMHEQPVAQRRLAQIASFVEANPHERALGVPSARPRLSISGCTTATSWCGGSSSMEPAA